MNQQAIHPVSRTGLSREMSLLGLVATGVCSMLGSAINVIPFMIQKNIPGIGPLCASGLFLRGGPRNSCSICLCYSRFGHAKGRRPAFPIFLILLSYKLLISCFSSWVRKLSSSIWFTTSRKL